MIARLASHRRLLALIAGTAVLAGCASASAPIDAGYAAVAGVEEVDLAWRPTPGMRLVHRVTTDVDASGPLTGPVAAADKKQHTVLTRTTEVTAVTPESFDLRFSQDGSAIPATLRLSRAWEPIAVVFDDPPALAGQDKVVLEVIVRRLAEPLSQGAQVFRRWKAGDTQPLELRPSVVQGVSGTGEGTMTFRRVVIIDGRQAAEFDWQGRTEFVVSGDPGRGAPGRMSIAGKEWRDLATGASLRLSAKASAEFTRQGRATHVNYQTDEVLDLAASRL